MILRDVPRLLLVLLLFVSVILATTNALRANSWQKRLDNSLWNVDGASSAQARLRTFQRALQDPALRKDVSRAFGVVREQGFGKGHPEVIELLWPRGTIARSDLEGLQAFVTRQLPERWEDVSSSRGTTTGLRGTVVVPELTTVSKVLFDRIRDRPDRYVTLAQNALRSEPKAVESLDYETLRTIVVPNNGTLLTSTPPVEIRRYSSYHGVTCTLQSGSCSLENMGAGLNRLSSYLVLGDNLNRTIMEMTTPFIMSNIMSHDDDKTTMTLKLPGAYVDAPPEPSFNLDSKQEVSLQRIPESTVATLRFSGICTDQEIARRTATLLEMLRQDDEIRVVGGGNDDPPKVMVLQYNAPGTLPWRRQNEVGVLVEKVVKVPDIVEEEEVVETKTEMVTETETETATDIKENDSTVVIAATDEEEVKTQDEAEGGDFE